MNRDSNLVGDKEMQLLQSLPIDNHLSDYYN